MIVRQRGGLYEDKESLLAHLLAPLDRPLQIKLEEKAAEDGEVGLKRSGAADS